MKTLFVVNTKNNETVVISKIGIGDTLLGVLTLESGYDEGRPYAVLLVEGIEIAETTARLIATDLILGRDTTQSVQVVKDGHWIGTDHGPHTIRISADAVAWHKHVVEDCRLVRVEE